MMNSFSSSKRISAILLFTIGILLSTSLTAARTWAGYEADFYGFQRIPGERLDGLTCPALMTHYETGTIRVQVHNSSEKTIEPILRIDTSTREVPASAQSQLKIEPGETRQFEQPVTTDNIDLGFFIFAKAYRYPAYALPTAEATCGILVLDVPFLNGQQIFYVWLAFGLLFVPLGLWMWSSETHPEGASRTLNAAKALAVLALAGLFVSIQGVWVLGLGTLSLTLLMSAALLRFISSK